MRTTSRAKRWPKAANAIRLDAIDQAEEAHAVLSQALMALDRSNRDLVRQRITDARRHADLIRVMLENALPGDEPDNALILDELKTRLIKMEVELSTQGVMIRDLLVLLETKELAERLANHIEKVPSWLIHQYQPEQETETVGNGNGTRQKVKLPKVKKPKKKGHSIFRGSNGRSKIKLTRPGKRNGHKVKGSKAKLGRPGKG